MGRDSVYTGGVIAVREKRFLGDRLLRMCGGTAEEALQQINEKQYALPFVADPRRLYKIGVNFSAALRGIEKWVVE